LKPDPEAIGRTAFTRRALSTVFWFATLSLLFNALLGDMGLIQGLRQRREMTRLRQEVGALRQNNERLLADIKELRHDPYRIETIAREELGLTRPGEILFLFQDREPPEPAPGLAPDLADPGARRQVP
jgi:cell division protein FtsB